MLGLLTFVITVVIHVWHYGKRCSHSLDSPLLEWTWRWQPSTYLASSAWNGHVFSHWSPLGHGNRQQQQHSDGALDKFRPYTSGAMWPDKDTTAGLKMTTGQRTAYTASNILNPSARPMLCCRVTVASTAVASYLLRSVSTYNFSRT